MAGVGKPVALPLSCGVHTMRVLSSSWRRETKFRVTWRAKASFLPGDPGGPGEQGEQELPVCPCVKVPFLVASSQLCLGSREGPLRVSTI